MHSHGTNHVKPHVHFDMNHVKDEPRTSPSAEDYVIIEKINKWLRRR